jgi:polar amino acid transport system substrate-binding protein
MRTQHRLAILAVTAVLIAACSGAASQAPTTTPASAAPAGATASSSATDAVLTRIQQSGSLRIGGAAAPPFTIQNPDGSWDGYDIALLKLLAQSLNVKLDIITTGFDAVVAGLQTNKWDLVPGLCDTPAREAVIAFTKPSVSLKLQFYFKADNPKLKNAKSIADLNDPSITIVVGTGSEGAQAVPQLAPKATLKSIPGLSDADALQQVLSGHADVVPADYPTITTAVANAYPNMFMFVPQDMSSEPTSCPVAWGIPQGAPAFQAYVSKFLDDQQANGTIAKMQQQYFSDKYEKVTP